MTHKVGDKLWVVYTARYRGPPHEVTVTKLGRKWVYLSNGDRFVAKHDNPQLQNHLDGRGYSSDGLVYESKEAWSQSQDREEAWSALRAVVSRAYAAPPGVSADEIVQFTERVNALRKE